MSKNQQRSDAADDVHQWLLHRLHALQAKVLTSNLQLPNGYKQQSEVDIDELSKDDESLLTLTLKHVAKENNRYEYVKLLIANDINVNVQDKREKRTALMHACIQDDCENEAVLIINSKNCNLMLQDRLGNTALMYAALKGREMLTDEMAMLLSKSWGLSAIQLKNCMGNTAEDLAIRNKHFRCARMLQAQRLHMLACLNKQMILAGQIGSRQWHAFTSVLKCLEKFDIL
uniref:ANK_REP_REGION domain-containing protein n=1 Tax=Syphacia muris TaxID=451379 RepID=A0A0N5ABE1_9BILA